MGEPTDAVVEAVARALADHADRHRTKAALSGLAVTMDLNPWQAFAQQARIAIAAYERAKRT